MEKMKRTERSIEGHTLWFPWIALFSYRLRVRNNPALGSNWKGPPKLSPFSKWLFPPGSNSERFRGSPVCDVITLEQYLRLVTLETYVMHNNINYKFADSFLVPIWSWRASPSHPLQKKTSFEIENKFYLYICPKAFKFKILI